MKRLFKGHIFFGRIADICGNDNADYMSGKSDVRPSCLRWFCGMHDLDATVISRPL